MAAALMLGTSCSGGQEASAEKEFDANADFNDIIEQARATTVSFYGWGGDEDRNEWIDTAVASALKDRYDITLERVPMDINQILAKLSGGKTGGKQGGIDRFDLDQRRKLLFRKGKMTCCSALLQVSCQIT